MTNVTRPTTTGARLAAALGASVVGLLLVVTSLTPALAAPERTELLRGQWLAPGETMQSANAQHSLTLTPEGALVLSNNGGTAWQTKAFGIGLRGLQVRDNGDLAIVDASNRQLWATGTRSGTKLVIADNGELQLQNAAAEVIWKSTDPVRDTLRNDEAISMDRPLVSNDGGCQAVLEATSDLVVHCASGVRWRSGTAGTGGTHFYFTGAPSNINSSGRLELRRDDGSVVWRTFSGGTWANMLDDGQLVTRYRSPFGPMLTVTEWSSDWEGPPDRILTNPKPDLGLSPGEWKTSTNGRYRLAMESGGLLTQYDHGRPIWRMDSRQQYATLQLNGRLSTCCLTLRIGSAIWWSNASNGAFLAVQDDGNIVLYTAAGRPVWTKADLPYWGPGNLVPTERLSIGQALTSPNGRYTLVMQSDGNLVEYAAGRGALWHTNTYSRNGEVLTLQSDGNLVLYGGGNNTPLWSTRTSGGSRLVLQDDGNLVLYSASGRPLWYNNAR